MFNKWITLLWTLRRQVKLAWQLLKDERIPTWQKAIPFLPLIYILSPFNVLTFAIPIFGQVDDVMLIILALELFERQVDPKILSDYQKGKNKSISEESKNIS